MHQELPEIWLEAEPPLVLIAHPDEAIRQRMEEELADYRTRGFGNGREVLASCLAERPDAVIAHVDLPGMNGAEVCQAMRSNADLCWIPVAVTTHPEAPAFEDAIEAGAAEVITIPFTAVELQLRLRNMVRTQLYLRALERKNHVITEALNDLKESEAMLVHAEKLSMLGEMSAGIVHEINNPLNYSRSALFVLQRVVNGIGEGELRDELDEVIGDVTDGLDRVGQIVRDLRAFAAKGTVEVRGLDLGHVVRIATRLIGDRLSNIRYIERVPEGLLVQGNENNLCQVILNLLKNGVEATEAAGRSLREAEIRLTAEDTEEGVVLRIRDNGCGISAKQRRNMFEPFFTTKERGQGMGLGLSICRRIVEDHGATIEVDSVPGQFTEFTLRFPPGFNGGREREDRQTINPAPGSPVADLSA